MRYYGGIDLHSTNSVVVVSDERDRIVFKKRLPNVLDVIVTALEPYRAALRGLVVESTYNWYWLVDGLQDSGYAVHLANTVALKQYSGLKYADDGDDAAWLAHLLRVGLLAECYICPRETRGTRDLLRRRGQLVRQKVTNMLAIQNQVTRATGARINANLVRKLDDGQLDDLVGDGDAALGIRSNLRVMQALVAEIDRLERILAARLRPDPVCEALRTVPGIGMILAMTIRLEAGEVTRFAGPGKFASYCRCVASKRISNGRKKGEGNRKSGNRYLAWAFMEAATFAIRYDARARAFYQRKKARTHRVVALKAVAHKLARACFHVMRDGVPFEPTRCFG